MSIVRKEGYEMPFKNVYFEVAGICNARCRYCVTGAKSANPGGIMQADTFNATLHNLERVNLIDSRSVIELYNWGEVFLHPDLQSIIRIINDHGLRYAISTNGSIVPQIDEAFVKNLVNVRFSMCGFSQRSYDRIHQLKFDRIRENIGPNQSPVYDHRDTTNGLRFSFTFTDSIPMRFGSAKGSRTIWIYRCSFMTLNW